jgi:hypothetical protein
MLEGANVSAPPSLLSAYPAELNAITRSEAFQLK